jgi:hypothetical protein
LAQLIRLTAKNVNLFVEGNRRVLESANWCYSLSWDRSAPLKSVQIKDQQVIEPELAVATTKYEHLVVDNARGMELSHWCLSSDNARDIETEFLNSFLEIDEYNIRQNLKSIPTSINDNLTSVPNLTGVAHSWLRQFVLVNFRLGPGLLFLE